jgi:MFS family permease
MVNVAMPTIGRSLHASGAELQLVVAGYTVSYAMLLITGARLGDLAGRRRMFLQLGHAAGVAVLGSVFLTLAAHAPGGPGGLGSGAPRRRRFPGTLSA